MKRTVVFKLMLLFASYVILSLSAAPGWAANETKAALNSSDCVKCHSAEPGLIDSKGGKHKTVTCQNCHANHRPSSKDNIPVCSQCHKEKPHFQLKGCLTCHSNPHTPLAITFADKLTEPCLSCHTPQIKQLTENKSKHTALFCTTCHAAVHKKIPACTQCHKPHSADVTAATCKQCHKPHMPRSVTYAAETDSKLCAACHKKAYDLLAASQAAHGTFACAFCHQEKHKAVPKCKDCHGEKHPPALMAKFPKCGDCHKIAHDLNNWKSETSAPAAAPKDKKK